MPDIRNRTWTRGERLAQEPLPFRYEGAAAAPLRFHAGTAQGQGGSQEKGATPDGFRQRRPWRRTAARERGKTPSLALPSSRRTRVIAQYEQDLPKTSNHAPVYYLCLSHPLGERGRLNWPPPLTKGAAAYPLSPWERATA